MILDFHIEPGEREIPSDFASRLSTVACRDDLWEFCRDFGLDGQGIVDGNEGAVEALSELAGVQASGLLLETFRPMGRKREFVHKGQHFVHLNLMRSRVVDVVGMVLDGKLGRVGMRRGAIGLNSILVDVDALRSLIPGPPPGWLLLREAEKELRINNGALRALIANGFMDAITVKNPTHGGTQRLIEKRDIHKFNERYVTLFNLAQEKRMNILKLKDMLEEAGVKPVRDRNALECTLYLRSTIDI